MTAYLPPNLLALFEPRSPLRFLPVPSSTQAKPRRSYDGIASYAMFFEDPKSVNITDLLPLETVMQRKKRIAEERKLKQEKIITEKLESWDPNSESDSKTTDPYHTLFVSRLNYETTEDTLRKEFEFYGPILKLKIVRDKEGKSRGYAFIEYERERDMKNAYKQADRKTIDGKRVIVDMERGRTIPNWRPRRLGGGLGGRPDLPPKSKIPQTPDRSSGYGGGEYHGGYGGSRGDRMDSYRPRGGYGGSSRGPPGRGYPGGRPEYRGGPPRDDRGYSRDYGRDSRDRDYEGGYSRSRDSGRDYRDDRDGFRRDEYRGSSRRDDRGPRGEDRDRMREDRYKDERSSGRDDRRDERSSRDYRSSRHYDSRDSGYRGGSRF